ncbi:aKG-HExxH-type peptide beta-hydroxylase [Streptomyces parvus]|uniref:aKG-HExxH-type peptide beta-hydroxylase n=1 Tax=Streptomyces parvus TaxID=66428 RepID=UPI0036420482
MLDDDRTEEHHAPWRPDPRRLPGLLHGAYAFVGVAGLPAGPDRAPGGRPTGPRALPVRAPPYPDPYGPADPRDLRGAHRARPPTGRRTHPHRRRPAARTGGRAGRGAGPCGGGRPPGRAAAAASAVRGRGARRAGGGGALRDAAPASPASPVLPGGGTHPLAGRTGRPPPPPGCRGCRHGRGAGQSDGPGAGHRTTPRRRPAGPR